MAFEDDFLKGALVAQGPSPTSPGIAELAPPGFGGQGVVDKPKTAIPPAYFNNSPRSLTSQNQEPTILDRIINGMIGAGTKPGEIPAPIKLRMLQAEADRQQQQTEIAWANLHRSNAVFEHTLQQQEKDNIVTATKLSTNAMADIRATGDPELRTTKVNHFANLLDELSPGAGNLIRAYGKQPHRITTIRAMMENFNTPAASSLRELYTDLGDNIYENPQAQHLADIMAKDGVNTVVGHFDPKDREKLLSGKMSQDEFIDTLKMKALDPEHGMGLSLQIVAGLEEFLSYSDLGEGYMAGRGIVTNKSKAKQQQKMREAGPIDVAKQKDFEDIESQLEDAKANPGKYAESYINKLNQRRDVYLKQSSPESQPGPSPNVSYNNRLEILSRGKFRSNEDIMALPKKEQPAAWAMAEQARKEADMAVPQSRSDVMLEEPGDTTGYFKADDLQKSGKLTPVRGNVSKLDLRTNRNYFKLTPDQQKAVQDMNAAAGSSAQIFDLATEAYDPKLSLAGLTTAESALVAASDDPNSLVKAAAATVAKQTYPRLATYVARREGTLGKFARSISGEVGVLTNQDIGRVRNLFPTAGDSAEIRKSKLKALQSLISLNRRFQVELFTGEVDSDTLKNSPAYQNSVQGILGSVEGLTKNKPSIDATSGTTSAENNKTGSRTERLLNKMLGK